MKTSWKILGFASTVFCLLLLFGAAPSLAQCGPGGAGCEGCIGTCSGVACGVPGQGLPSPGPCTPAQLAAGGTDISTVTSCAGSLEGVCKCYLPSFFQITQQNCARVYFSTQPGEEPTWQMPTWEKPMVLASSAKCVTSVEMMTPATSAALAGALDESGEKAGAS